MDPGTVHRSAGVHNHGTSTPPMDGNLHSFVTKVAVGGDLAAECMLLFSEDEALQAKTNRQGIHVKRRAVRHAMEKRRKLIKKIREAQKNSGFWSGLSKVFAGIAGVAVGALTILAGPGLLVGAVGLVGAVAYGGCDIAKGWYAKKAGNASADKFQVEQFKKATAEMGDEFLRSLEDVVNLEQKMHQRILALLESETQSRILQERRMS